MSYKRISGVPVIEGGTGQVTLTTAYGVLCAGTTATNPVQTLAALGASGTVLTSNGAGALPSFQSVAGGVSSVTGTANQVTASPTTGAVVVSTPVVFIAPGSIESTTSTTADTFFNTPTTTSTVGQYRINNSAVLHTFGTGLGNTFVGLGAGNFTLTTSEHNTAIGSLAGASLAGTTGHNTYVGYSAGTLDDGAGGTNTAVGHNAFSAFTGATVARNTCLGGDSLILLTGGRRNVALGYSAGSSLTTSDSDNIFIGASVTGTAGNNNRLVIGGGTGTGTNQINKATISGIYSKANSGTQNLAVIDSNDVLGSSTSTSITGSLTLTDFISTSTNVLLPSSTSTAGNIEFNNVVQFQVHGTSNVWIGDGAGNYTSTGSGLNQGIGHNALAALTNGNSNTAIGDRALTANTTGSNNIAIGNQSLQTCTTSIENIAIGDSALNKVSTGTGQNIGIGADAAAAITTGSNNIAIGYLCGLNWTTTESNNVYLSTARGTVGESNVIRIGFTGTSNTSQQTKAFVDGITGVTVTGTAVLVSTTGQLGIAVSSNRFKENIQDLGDTDVLKLRPVSFNYTVGDDHSLQSGLIAEEVNEIIPQLVVLDKEGLPQTVKYHDLPVLMLSQMQKLAKRIEYLEGVISGTK